MYMQAKALYLNTFAITIYVGATHAHLLEYMQAVPHASSGQQHHPIHMKSCTNITQMSASSARGNDHLSHKVTLNEQGSVRSEAET